MTHRPTRFPPERGHWLDLGSTTTAATPTPSSTGATVCDAAARLSESIDREGVDLWGFDQWRQIDDHLDLLDAWSSRS